MHVADLSTLLKKFDNKVIFKIIKYEYLFNIQQVALNCCSWPNPILNIVSNPDIPCPSDCKFALKTFQEIRHYSINIIGSDRLRAINL